MVLSNPSDEQKYILGLLKDNNVIIDSVAGSGKTTTNLHIAKKYAELQILLLTYNAKLKLETREKVQHLGLNNIEVHSYHSFCVKYYDRKCYNDTVLTKVMKSNDKPLKHFYYDVIILDEAQDVTPLYYKLVCKIYLDNYIKANLCIIGDRYQSIYDFNKADERFIIYADKLFNFNDVMWKTCHLSRSFRITIPMANFINNCMLTSSIVNGKLSTERRITSDKISTHKPRYIVCNTFIKKKDLSKPYAEIKYYLNMGYTYSDIFVLTASVKSELSPVRVLANILSNSSIPVFVPVSDEEKLEEDVLVGKVVFSTFHQVKGLERKVIIVFNFDNTYFKLYKKDKNPNICPNELYVAATRGLEHLTLFHHFTNDYLPFINSKKITTYANVIMHYKLKIKKTNYNKSINTPVTTLIRHLPSEVIDNCFDYLKVVNQNKCGKKIKIPSKSEQKYGHENVSEITGIAIPSYFEYKLKGIISIAYNLISFKFSKSAIHGDQKPFSDERIVNLYTNIENKCDKENSLLELATMWNAHSSGYVFKLNQITEYNWLSERSLRLCMKRFDRLNITKEAIFEQRIELKGKLELLDRELVGYIDCIDNKSIFEFKCVNQLEKTHYLQLAIYMYMLESIKQSDKSYYLYNVITDKLDRIVVSMPDLIKMMSYLIDSKYGNVKKISDLKFIKNHRSHMTYKKEKEKEKGNQSALLNKLNEIGDEYF